MSFEAFKNLGFNVIQLKSSSIDIDYVDVYPTYIDVLSMYINDIFLRIIRFLLSNVSKYRNNNNLVSIEE